MGNEGNGVGDGDLGEVGVVGLLGLHGMKLASVELITDTGDRIANGDEDVVGKATTFFSSAPLRPEGGFTGEAL